MDIYVIHKFITNSYWAKNIPIQTIKKAIENSLCFGVFTAENDQIGFARVVSDYATFAYLADVFILKEHRGKGISKWLIEGVLEHPELQGLRRVSLATQDAHGLYKQFGFTPLELPERFMELHKPNLYQ
ncbi:N-acetyltransferase [Parashewanella curva]|uniref:N-acetyltransferase n=2 Tax=Parashewanella curva TaxID=2338552 RepID=A0A3L8PZ73_9GAMM|nr:N-acetyltransferase [Parashewanella curva]